MSTAIIRPSSQFYDFGDLHLKNQTASRLNHMNNTSPNSGTPSTTAANSPTANSNVIGQSSMPALSSLQFNNNHNLINNLNHINNNNINNTMTNGLNATNNPFSQLPAVNLNINNNSVHQMVQQQHQHQQQHLQQVAMIQRINAAAALVAQHQQQHQQQQHQQKMLIHSALTRAVSHPQAGGNGQHHQNMLANVNNTNNAGNTNVASLVNSLIENLGHRKLERTQSEPLPQVNTSRYKTELCRPFEEAGECKYGEKCQFAHGMHELRNLQRHPKYKTELCRTFHSVGFCPYGPRCHFVHNAEEARNHNRALHAAYVRAAAATGGPMPMSPPMSMSTGSDRASPTGSLSLSPTNSMASFFPDQASPSSFTSQQQFQFPQSPPQSPTASNQSMASPVSTPPPQQQQQHHHQQHQLGNGMHNNNCSSSGMSSAGSSVNGGGEQSNGEARLPIFNQLSSTMDAFKHLAM